MTDEDIRELRLADNMTNSETGYDYGVLDLEIEDLDFDGFDFDLSNAMPENLDDLFAPVDEKEKEPKKIQCPHCGEWFEP